MKNKLKITLIVVISLIAGISIGYILYNPTKTSYAQYSPSPQTSCPTEEDCNALEISCREATSSCNAARDECDSCWSTWGPLGYFACGDICAEAESACDAMFTQCGRYHECRLRLAGCTAAFGDN